MLIKRLLAQVLIYALVVSPAFAAPSSFWYGDLGATGGGGGTPPTIAENDTGAIVTVNAASGTGNLANASASNGDLLMECNAISAVDTSIDFYNTAPGEYSMTRKGSGTGASGMTLACGSRTVDGTETTTVASHWTSSTQGDHGGIRATGWTTITAGTATSATDAAPDCGSISTPAAGVVVCVCGHDDSSITWNSNPSGYTQASNFNANANATRASGRIVYLSVTSGASQDPPAFALSASTEWACIPYFIKGT